MLRIARPLAVDPTVGLPEALAAFYRRCEARGLKEGTIAFYRHRLEGFARFVEARGLSANVAALSAAVLRDFLAERMEQSAAAAHHARAALSAFFRFLLAEEAVAENPVAKVERVRQPRRVMVTPTAKEVEALLAAASGKAFPKVRLRALLLVLVDCGLRATEVCGLDLADVSWSEQTLLVRRAKGSKERVVPFGRATRGALEPYLLRRGTLAGQERLFVTVYGEALTRYQLGRLLARAAQRAGVPEYGPHCFRRFFAVTFLRQGGDVFSLQKLLGHSSLEMSRRYAELSGEDVIRKHRAASPGDAFLSTLRPTRGRRQLR